MKKFRTLIILIVGLLLFAASPADIHADDDGYYIENMNVDVGVTDDRKFNITETIDVNFEEERHGIIRKIPLASGLEDYTITGISVDGAPSEINEGSDVEIKIGDEDEYIDGKIQYVIKYTINHYSDEQEEGDYIFFNVLGTEWDTRVEKFTSTITYPSGASLEKINVTDGEYGSTTSKNASYSTEGNKIIIKSKGTIDSYSGITVNAMLNEGAFKNAPIKKYPYTINSEIINANINTDKTYLIEKYFEVEVNEDTDKNNSSSIYFWNDSSESKTRIEGISVEGEDLDRDEIESGIKYFKVNLPSKKGVYKFKVSYKLIPRLSSIVAFDIGNYGIEGKTKNKTVNISSSFNIDNYGVEFREVGLNRGKERYKALNDGKTLVFNNLNDIYPKEQIKISLAIDNSLFNRPISSFEKAIRIIAPLTALIAIVLFLIFREKRKISPPVNFYPPKGLNSAEVGYVYNVSVKPTDVTSLIFYWASKGYLKIKFKSPTASGKKGKKKDSIELIKLRELDNNTEAYEKEFFEDIFKHGVGNVVKLDDLKGKMNKYITKTVTKVYKNYKGNKAIFDTKSTTFSVLTSLLAIIPMALFFSLTMITDNLDIIEVMICTVMSPVFVLVFYIIMLIINKNRQKSPESKGIIKNGIILIVYLAACIGVSFFFDVSIITKAIVIISSFIIILFASLIGKRSDYGRDLLEEILGFRNFMLVAEKERLEALIDQDPEYFYNTLPFAQVLGVTDKWTDKFKYIEMEVPSYYSGYDNLTTYMLLSQIQNDMNTISQDMNYSNTDTGSSGGFSGGGFSGGGSGGGGGSSW